MIKKASKSELEVFKEYLRRHGLRYTKERENIIKEIFSIHDHFDVDSLYMNMRKRKIQVAKSSIYRLLPLLIDAGLVQSVFFDNGQMHYEHVYGHEDHCHLRCISCKKIEEVTDKRIEDIAQTIENNTGFQIIDYKLEFKGFCPSCQAKNNK